jgi:hypothetical protein
MIKQEYIDYSYSDDYCDENDYSVYIFETAIETFYGREVWKILNDRNSIEKEKQERLEYERLKNKFESSN